MVYFTCVIFFDNQDLYEWLEDRFVRELIEDVDNSVVASPECIKSENDVEFRNVKEVLP